MLMFAASTPVPLVGLDLPRAFHQARARVGMKHDTLARLMGIEPTQLSAQLAGHGHISLGRLLSVARDSSGRAFLRELLPTVNTWAGVDDADAMAQAIVATLEAAGGRIAVQAFSALIDRLQVRMLKAELGAVTEKERAS